VRGRRLLRPAAPARPVPKPVAGAALVLEWLVAEQTFGCSERGRGNARMRHASATIGRLRDVVEAKTLGAGK